MSAPMSLRPTETVLRRDRSLRVRRLRGDDHGHLTLTNERLVFSRALPGLATGNRIHEVLVSIDLPEVNRVRVTRRNRGLQLVVEAGGTSWAFEVPDEQWWLSVQRAGWLATRVQAAAA